MGGEIFKTENAALYVDRCQKQIIITAEKPTLNRATLHWQNWSTVSDTDDGKPILL